MRARISPVEALVSLPRLVDEADRRASWRQAIAALGQSARVDRPPPLDGTEPRLIARAVQIALESRLAEDLDWIEPSKATVALYELTSALPAGPERRELGRRLYLRVYEGTAATFGAVATRMALGAARSLDTPPLRARVALLFELPIGTSVSSDLLALALVLRRDTFARWLQRPSMGALPARRLAARLLEYAAREAVARSLQGDSYPCQRLLGPEVQPTFRLLLSDREPLVWRHAAVARGLLASVDRQVREEVELALDPAMSPTEWRRAAVSLVALAAGDPSTVLAQCRRLLHGEIGVADPGIAAAMVAALPRVMEAEPEAADTILEWLSSSRRFDVAEAAGGLLSEIAIRSMGPRSIQLIRQSLTAVSQSKQPGVAALSERGLRLLAHAEPDSLSEGVRQALVAFELSGARAAHEAALHLVEQAHLAAERLEGFDYSKDECNPLMLQGLSDLDSSCLERSCLSNLLVLNRRPGESDVTVPSIERLYHRVGRLLIDVVETTGDGSASPEKTFVVQRFLRALLHLMDAETVQGEAEESGQRVRVRLRRATDILFRQIGSGPDAGLHRILCATLARCFDAAVRESVAEPSDLFLVVARHLSDRESISTIAEASTNPDVREPLRALAAFQGVLAAEGADPAFDLPSSPGLEESSSGDEVLWARRVVRLSQAVGGGGSYRAEALRHTILRMGRALEMAASARGLSELVDRNRSGIDSMRELEQSAAALRILVKGAERRVLQTEGEGDAEVVITTEIVPLSVLVERAIADGVPPNTQQIRHAVAEIVSELSDGLGTAISSVCMRLDSLPIAVSSDVYAIPLEKRRAPLPDWLLPRRTIGAFYVVRALGTGGVSSVFVVRRLEERNNPRATLFALKVPEYDPTTARSLSESEFLELFRDEAGALISLPQHPNIARFVTFDLAARPKPILVMELISGFGLDRLVRSRSMTVERALSYLVGILAGLQAMHQAGFGHLDLKPSNVILRDNSEPVLVDFGLSGRKIRPGCGTLDYCAPEVLGVTPDPASVTPMAADIYAFGAMAFEVLTGFPLFDGQDEMALVTQHVSHDGWPSRLAKLGRRTRTADLAVVLAACLRHDPRARPTATAVREALAPMASRLTDEPWPMSLERATDRPKSA